MPDRERFSERRGAILISCLDGWSERLGNGMLTRDVHVLAVNSKLVVQGWYVRRGRLTSSRCIPWLGSCIVRMNEVNDGRDGDAGDEARNAEMLRPRFPRSLSHLVSHDTTSGTCRKQSTTTPSKCTKKVKLTIVPQILRRLHWCPRRTAWDPKRSPRGTPSRAATPLEYSSPVVSPHPPPAKIRRRSDAF